MTFLLYLFVVISLGWVIGSLILYVGYTMYDSITIKSRPSYIRSSEIERIKSEIRRGR